MGAVRVVGTIVGRQLALALLVFGAMLVGLVLAYGTSALMWLGLSRTVAGSIVTVIVVVACIAGLGWFAVNVIDWD